VDRLSRWGSLFLGPLRFWLGAGAFLLVVAGIAYGYGAWYAGALLQDAATVREVRANSSWTAQFQYEEVNGIRRRVELPGPDGFNANISLDDLATVDTQSAGYQTYGAVLRELGNEEDEAKKKEEEQAKAMSREELLKNLRQTGIMVGEVDTSSWRESVDVGSGLTAEQARSRAEQFRQTGRDVEVETYTDGSGQTRYRLKYGRVSTPEEAQALRHELEQNGLLESGPSSSGGHSGGTGDGGGTTTPPTGTHDGGTTTPPATGGGTTPPSTGGGTAPPAGGADGGRSVQDL
jgi:hypothetical protein